jgi:predicted ribosomally synthesized peptide with nif11-like leader
MSEEQLKSFLEMVKTDTSLQEKLKGVADVDAALVIAKEAGFAITAEDIQSMQSATTELSDDELEGVAGGIVPGAIIAGAALASVAVCV